MSLDQFHVVSLKFCLFGFLIPGVCKSCGHIFQARPNPSGHSSTALFSMERSLSYVSYAGRSSWLKLGKGNKMSRH